MSEQPENPNPNLRPCPDCGKSISRRAPSCPHCGREMVRRPRDDDDYDDDDMPRRRKSGSSVGTVVAIICGAGFLFMMVIIVCLVAIGNIGKGASATFQSVAGSLSVQPRSGGGGQGFGTAPNRRFGTSSADDDR